MTFVASRGGHASGHLREAFLYCFEGFGGEPWYAPLSDEETVTFLDLKAQRRWDALDLKGRALWLTGQLWNCRDTLPALACWRLASRVAAASRGPSGGFAPIWHK